jgi:sugar phosphate isomerase/epimerase
MNTASIQKTMALAVVCFGNELKDGTMTLPQFLDHAVDLGLDAVELCDRSIKNPAAVRGLLAERGLRMPSIALRNDFTGPANELPAQIGHIREWIGIAAEFGARTARVWTGWARTDATARRQITQAFDELIHVAVEHDVTLAVETHGGLSNDPEFMLPLARRYRSHFGICIDFGNLPEPRQEVIAAMLPEVVHVHVKTYAFDEQGDETTVPARWAVTELARRGYAGPWILEYEGEPPYLPGIEATMATVRHGVEAATAEPSR